MKLHLASLMRLSSPRRPNPPTKNDLEDRPEAPCDKMGIPLDIQDRMSKVAIQSKRDRTFFIVARFGWTLPGENP
jgi:hypothetical protein